MRNKALLLITLLITSGSLMAGGLTGNAGEQLLKDKATSAAPKEVVTGADAASQKLETAKNLKDKIPTSTGDATKMIKGKVQEEATKKTLDMVK